MNHETNYELLYTALAEMASTGEPEGLEVGLGYACDRMGIPVDMERHKAVMAFYGRFRSKLARAFRKGREDFFEACRLCQAELEEQTPEREQERKQEEEM